MQWFSINNDLLELYCFFFFIIGKHWDFIQKHFPISFTQCKEADLNLSEHKTEWEGGFDLNLYHFRATMTNVHEKTSLAENL